MFIAESINKDSITQLAKSIQQLKKDGGRLFILGVGGSAANASHAVNDFRKILNIEAYAPSDNVSELTARTNDDGWSTTYSAWLKGSRLNYNDAVLVFSVGGGSTNTSQNLVEAMQYAKQIGANIFSIVSRDGGIAKQLSQCCVLVPVIANDTITPHAEEWQGIIWHLLVSCVQQSTDKLSVRIFSDGADLSEMKKMLDRGIGGFTTNPTLMSKAGITDYFGFAKDALSIVGDKPISFEVFADDFGEMYEQAMKIAALGDNVFVKIPITNTKGQSSVDLIRDLDFKRVKLNVTAIFTPAQVKGVIDNITGDIEHIISVFAGRIADTGIDPIPVMQKCKTLITQFAPRLSLLWASPREVLNIYQADEIGCDIITATPDLLLKMGLYGKDLTEYSKETVQMFYNDAKKSGFTL